MKGGKNQERLFLIDSELLGVKKTDMPNMHDLIARHKSRYYFAAFFARPGMKVLDFPCGSGYGSEIIKDVEYHGMDYDDVTIEYASKMYSGKFYVDDLTQPKSIGQNYDLICCIEGLEHISSEYQEPLIAVFYDALAPSGRLFVSMPEAPGESGPSLTNPYHLGELTRDDFLWLLETKFTDVQILYHEDTLHNGQQATCMYAICRKEG
jgi:2-polyprenyl-3-methyl-5-hydroxy-6-metoxy-1,4-benzoquinol methylase